MVEIEIENPSELSFMPYGRLVTLKTQDPDKSGVGWKCWVPLEILEVSSKKLQIGLVTIDKQELIVDRMERHESREEMLWPINEPIIQLVGLPTKLENPFEKPDFNSVKAFRLQPGQIIIMSKGTWHSPAYTENIDTSYFYAIELSDVPEKYVQPWKKFQDDISIKMTNT